MCKHWILTTVFLNLFIFGCSSNEEFSKKVSLTFELTDEQAVQLTGEALTANGFNLKEMKAVSVLHNSTKLFARNQKSPNNGYVLWHNIEKPTLYEYMVYINYEYEEVKCKIATIK